MLALFKRELKENLCNLFGVISMAILLCAVGGFMAYFNIHGRLPGIEYALFYGRYALIAAIPLLCMRSMAEDRRNKTDLLYASLPVKPAAVVMGKYLALLAVWAIPVAVIAMYPVFLGAIGTVAYGTAYLSILHFFLLGAALIAVCQFISSLTRHFALAGLVSLAVMALLCGLPHLGGILPAGVPASILEQISPFRQFEDMARFGVLNLRSLAVLLLYPVLFVSLTLFVSATRGGRRGLRAPTVAVGSALLCAVIAANVILPFLSFRATEIDVNKNSMMTIDEETERFLSELEEDVTIYWICEDNDLSGSLLGEWFVRLLARYEALSEHVHVRRITDSEQVAEWEEVGLYNYDFIIRSEARYTVLTPLDMFLYSSTYVNEIVYEGQEAVLTAEEMAQYIDLFMAYEQVDISRSVYNHSCIANKALVSAMDYVTAEVIPHPYILTGFEGTPISDSLKAALVEYDFDEEITELDISRVDKIPDDASCVILHAPTSDLGDKETALLQAYLSGGGSLLLTTSPATWAEGSPNLQSLLTPYGLTALSGVVFETNEKYYVNSTDTLVPAVNSDHPLYSIFYENSAHRMPWAHAIGISQNAEASPIFATSDAAIRKPGGGSNETLGTPTQYCLGAHAVHGESYVIWFGSTDAFSDAVTAKATANLLYFTASIDLLRGEFASAYASIPGILLQIEPLEELGAGMQVVCILTLAVVIPVGVLVAGTLTWINRRRRLS